MRFPSVPAVTAATVLENQIKLYKIFIAYSLFSFRTASTVIRRTPDGFFELTAATTSSLCLQYAPVNGT
jgi:hypothetical protein